MQRKFIMTIFVLTVGVIAVESCTREASSQPHFIFKPAPSKGVVAQFMGQNITAEELYQGVEQDMYEAQIALHRIKMDKLKSHILEKLITREAKERGLSHDQFLDQVIAGGVKVSPQKIKDFVKSRGKKMEELSDMQKRGVEQFLLQQEKRAAIERWLGKKTEKSPVEVYLVKPKRPVFDVQVEGSPYMGGANAKVVIAEFSDFQCQYCQKGAAFLRELKQKYGNKVKIVFKNFPLSFHNNAEKAALAGLCAQDQGGKFFWKMHDKMFENQNKLDKKSLVGIAEKIGLKMQDFVACLESKKHLERIQKDRREGMRLGVKSTPTFFVNGKVVMGIGNQEEFIRLIDEELAK